MQVANPQTPPPSNTELNKLSAERSVSELGSSLSTITSDERNNKSASSRGSNNGDNKTSKNNGSKPKNKKKKKKANYKEFIAVNELIQKKEDDELKLQMHALLEASEADTNTTRSETTNGSTTPTAIGSQLSTKISKITFKALNQLRYYLSPVNLCSDMFLRQNMDVEGERATEP